MNSQRNTFFVILHIFWRILRDLELDFDLEEEANVFFYLKIIVSRRDAACRRISAAARISYPISIHKQSPYQCNAKSYQDDPIDAGDDLNIMWCQPVADLTRQHHLRYIGSEYKQQAG
jgi:hypothetical protein